jgi:hypothetical protein
MRKWIVILVVLVLVITIVYWSVPGSIKIHQTKIAHARATAFAREIMSEQTWQQWWPEKQVGKQLFPAKFEYKGNTFRFVEKRQSSLVISINKGRDSAMTELVFIPVADDSIELSWTGTAHITSNPFSRFQNFFWAKKVDSDMNTLLEKIASFYSSEDNLYGLRIQKELVQDSNLISIAAETKSYPATHLVYDLIDRLKNYIRENGAKELDYPMLNIYKVADSNYQTRVAIPTDKKLKNSDGIQYRWMLKGGNILVTEVRGGPYTIERAFERMETYVNDHHRAAPAIPFQSLITDRRQEPDTSRWITKLYWPVM